ncbi:MAG TPA: RES family NAD+ phosphorylase [Cyclobacteriaceae bacterium]|nr:RES family NAD+ phosphorylase [Cyclobacteriaceae bacterium]
MILYRCGLKKWIKDFSGKGASIHGGRWNSPGQFMVYAAENNVLAALEVAMRIPLESICADYLMIPLQIPGSVRVYKPKLPERWNHQVEITRLIGDQFIKSGKYLLMKVPSALISDSFNYLINPVHPDATRIKFQEPRSILFDKRLMEMIRTKS